MFFPRLRRHAKWMFVLLAVFFAGGFVIFGVGAGGTGIGDILSGRSSGGGEMIRASYVTIKSKRRQVVCMVECT